MIVNQDSTGRRRRPGLAVAIVWGLIVATVMVGVLMAGTSEHGVDREFGRAGTGLWPQLAAPSTAPAEAPDPPSAPTIGDLPLSDEALYIQVLDEEGIDYSSEQAAIDAGWSVCDYLDAGGTLLEAATIAEQEAGYSPYDAGYIVGAASSALCPGSGS